MTFETLKEMNIRVSLLTLIVSTFCCVQAATDSPSSKLRLLSLNFGCRDAFPIRVCDNCQTRFDLFADAISGKPGFEGLPDLQDVDVIIAQELSTVSQNFAQITAALEDLGFAHTTGEPLPTTDSIMCSNPATWDQEIKDLIGGLLGLDNGGLVIFSRHEIMATHNQNWCSHGYPTPAGYLATLLNVNDIPVVVFDLHTMHGVDSLREDIRKYQFGELSGVTRTLKESFMEADIPYSILLGGDFNEDSYTYQNEGANSACDKITSNITRVMFSNLNFDIKGACDAGKIGIPTWNPTDNGLTARFSDKNYHKLIDYLFQYSSSITTEGDIAINTVSQFKKIEGWEGQFCYNSFLGGAPGNIYTDTEYALTDHAVVTADFNLPPASGAPLDIKDKAINAFTSAIMVFNNDVVNNASCGQEGTLCWEDVDCCKSPNSWSSMQQHCDNLSCEPCSKIGESCGFQIEGSECCGIDEYNNHLGAHCDFDFSEFAGTCIPKYESGESCLFDNECISGTCSWNWSELGYVCT